MRELSQNITTVTADDNQTLSIQEVNIEATEGVKIDKSIYIYRLIMALLMQ